MSRRVFSLGLALGAGLLLTGTARAQNLFSNPACPTCPKTHVGVWMQKHREKNITICEPRICPGGCHGYFRTQWSPWMCPDGVGCATPVVTHPAPPMVTHPAQPMVTHPAPPAPLPVAPAPSPVTPKPKTEPKSPQSSARPVRPSMTASQPISIPVIPEVSVMPPRPQETAPAKVAPVPPVRLQDLAPVIPPVPVVAK
jgi:hypothetical protein